MKQNKPSIEKALNFGFKSFIDNIVTFLLLWAAWIGVIIFGCIAFVLGVMGLSISLTLLPQFISIPLGILLFGILAIVMFLLMYFYDYQMCRFGNAIYRGNPLPWTEFFTVKPHLFLNYAFARIIRIIKIYFGLLFFVIPGIYFAMKYYFAGYSFIEGSSVLQSQDSKLNREITQGNKLSILLFAFIGILFFYLSSILLLLPAPIFYLAQWHYYKQLTSELPEDTSREDQKKEVGVIEA